MHFGLMLLMGSLMVAFVSWRVVGNSESLSDS